MPVLLSEGQGDVVALVMAGARLGQSVADAGDLQSSPGGADLQDAGGSAAAADPELLQGRLAGAAVSRLITLSGLRCHAAVFEPCRGNADCQRRA